MSSIVHLARRWAGALSPAPPPPADEAWVDRWLLAAERELWTRLPNHDRRHAIGVARRFVELRPDASRAEVAGALLHDIGKLDSGLGVTARVWATSVGPRTARLRRYHEHEAIGAHMLAEAGSDPITVDLVQARGSAADALRTADDG
jgi:hypothetical protein